jgi:hypothetical protein
MSTCDHNQWIQKKKNTQHQFSIPGQDQVKKIDVQLMRVVAWRLLSTRASASE